MTIYIIGQRKLALAPTPPVWLSTWQHWEQRSRCIPLCRFIRTGACSKEYRGKFGIREPWAGVVSCVINPACLPTVRLPGMYEASFLTHLSALPRIQRPDAIIGICAVLSGGVLAAAFAKRHPRAPYGLIVQDLSGLAAMRSGIAGGRPLPGPPPLWKHESQRASRVRWLMHLITSSNWACARIASPSRRTGRTCVQRLCSRDQCVQNLVGAGRGQIIATRKYGSQAQGWSTSSHPHGWHLIHACAVRTDGRWQPT